MDNIQPNYNINDIVKKLKKLNWVPETSVGVFIIKDCILTQSYSGKSFIYRAVNFVTGEQKYLFYRKNEIRIDEHTFIVEKIKALPFYNMKQASDGTEMIDVIFREVFPRYGFKVREEQVSLSKHMYESMKNGKISISDIAVGLGKTHAYLVAAIVHGIFSRKGSLYKQMPIVITTSSIELQRSIIKEYIPQISKMLMENGIISAPISCVLRKGKENYVCDNRLVDYYHTLDPKRKRLEEYAGLKSMIQKGIIDLGEVENISAYDKRKIHVESNQCMTCSKYKSCSFQQFMKQARKSTYHFQICNHNYYLADILKRKDGHKSLLPDYQVVIIDEAHKLMDAAEQMYGTVIIENEIQKLMKKSIPMYTKRKDQKELKNRCNEVIAINLLFFNELIEQIPDNSYSEDTDRYPTIITLKAAQFLKRMAFNIQEIRKSIGYRERQLLMELDQMIDCLRVTISGDNIYWIENPKSNGQRTLASIHKRINEELGEDLWRKKNSMILTSGTIAVDGNFDYIKKQLGMSDLNKWRMEEISKSSPFDFRKNCMLYIADKMPFPNVDDPKYIDGISQEISALIRVSNGHALVLFTSYKPLRLIYKAIEKYITDIPLIAMKRGKNNAINDFKKSKNGVFFATGSMWEGINLPGDILSHLIIVKLPFPIPDPISEYERKQYPDMNAYLDSVLVPNMLIKLRQGVGRLIRSETDTGVISILDSRAGAKGKYHDAVLASLPKCHVTSDINEMHQFLLRKKDKKYFE